MGCLVLIFNLIHLGILNPENLAHAYSILRFKWHTILSLSMANHPLPLKRKFFQCVMHLKNHYITKKNYGTLEIITLHYGMGQW